MTLNLLRQYLDKIVEANPAALNMQVAIKVARLGKNVLAFPKLGNPDLAAQTVPHPYSTLRSEMVVMGSDCEC